MSHSRHPLWTSNESVLALLHAEVERTNELLAAALRAGCAACGGHNRDALQKDVFGSNNDTTLDTSKIIEGLGN